MLDWNSELYLKFERERGQAARDLLARIPPLAPRKIVDLGCGPGNSAAMLALYFRGAEILGVDTSENMLKAARERLPEARFILEDLNLWEPEEPVDLIFANAALHFAPEHEKLLTKFMSFLAPGGVLALASLAHRMKGASLSISAVALAKAAAGIEAAAQSGNLPEAGAVTA